MQVNTVGKAESVYSPGVLVGQTIKGSVSEAAGFQSGDIIIQVE